MKEAILKVCEYFDWEDGLLPLDIELWPIGDQVNFLNLVYSELDEQDRLEVLCDITAKAFSDNPDLPVWNRDLTRYAIDFVLVSHSDDIRLMNAIATNRLARLSESEENRQHDYADRVRESA